MPGYPVSRFVDLRPEVAEEFRCSICLNLFEDAVDTKCKHTYCYQCIHQWLTSQTTKQCPECRQSLVSANSRPAAAKKGHKNHNNTNPKLSALFIGGDVVVERNRRVNNFISILRVKCEWEANGCTNVMALEGSAGHSRNCSYRMCDRCGLLYGTWLTKGVHDCLISLLRNRCLTKTDKLYERVMDLRQFNDQLVAISDRNESQIKVLRNENKKLVASRGQKDSELTKLRNKNKTIAATRDQKHNELIKLGGENSALQSSLDQTQFDLAAMKRLYWAKYDESGKMVGELRRRVDTLEAENNSLRTKFQDFESELSNTALTETRDGPDTAAAQLNTLEPSREERNNVFMKLEQEMEGLVTTRDQNETDLLQIKTVYRLKCKEFDEVVTDLRKRGNLLLAERDGLLTKLFDAKTEISRIRRENARLTEGWYKACIMSTKPRQSLATFDREMNKLDKEWAVLQRLEADQRRKFDELVVKSDTYMALLCLSVIGLTCATAVIIYQNT